LRFHEILYKGITLWFSQTTQPSSSSLFVPAATNTELLPILWRHHRKTKQMYAVLNCWGVRRAHLVLVHSLSC